MSKKLTSQEYDALAQRLERMSDGIARHKAESGFPARLDEAKRRAMRAALEEMRAKWETLFNEAEQAYKAYLAHYGYCKAELGQDDEAVRGFYGKYNAAVADFGTAVMKKAKAKKNNQAAAKQAKG